jgi:predicted TIM-barrel fold metal-dependent hydrolase
MQNVHGHVWDADRHLSTASVAETDLARGRRLDLAVRFDDMMVDLAPCERAIVFGIKARRTRSWVPDAYVAAIVARAPKKLVGFASCDPTQDGYMEELRHGIEQLGLVGIKMGHTYAGIDPRDPRCGAVYAYCQEMGLPILCHTGTTFRRTAPLGYSRPWLWDEVAIAYPELRMVLAHVGHPFCAECLVVIRKHPHLYADISALFYRPWQFYNTLIAAQEYQVTHKLLFGTDYPFTTTADSVRGLRGANDVVAESGLPRVLEETIEGILSRDAFALLGIDR